MDERDTEKSLRDLGQRLDRAQRDRQKPAAEGSSRGGGYSSSALGFGFRIGLELVVAVAVGTGLGWAFDRALGTRPWGTIVLLFLGIGAGMWNVYRAVTGMGMAMGFRRDQASPPPQTKANWSDDED